ncbi:MAG: hypothetical protein K6E42_08885 [Synergistes sp.]|nr:hypothetical protein [Synergistes sp.]
MGSMIAVISIALIAMIILAIAALVQYFEERSEEAAKLRRWERKVNQAYRENPYTPLGRV